MEFFSLTTFSVQKRLRLRFCLILDNQNQQDAFNTINVFSADGNKYRIFQPHPYLSVEIVHDQTKGFVGGNKSRLKLSRYKILEFKSILERVVKSLKIEDMFFYTNGTLRSNSKRVMENTIRFLTGTHVIRIHPGIYVNPDENNSNYEGVTFIDETDGFGVTLTHQESQECVLSLQSVLMNFDTLTLGFINSYLILHGRQTETIKTLPQTTTVVEVRDQQPTSVNPPPLRGSEIPEI